MDCEVNNTEIVFGPVPSRRLGRSMGINNIPPKNCSYSCVYCQIGKTNTLSTKRKEIFKPEKIYNAVYEKVNYLRKNNEQLDYLTFIADGEPTLDLNIGKCIEILKPLGINIAVITNSSLLWDKNVREDLMKADLVSVKIDTVIPAIWHKINRPHGSLKLEKIVNGIREFVAEYSGKLITETMLIKDINVDIKSLQETVALIDCLKPAKSFILIPTRPTPEIYAIAPDENIINLAYQIFNNNIENVELAISYEGTNFSYQLNSEKELLSILSVHPMRYDAVEEFLKKSNMGWDIIYQLVNKRILKKVYYQGNYFLMKSNLNIM